MKKFKFWALLTALTGLSIVFISCGKNDDEVLYTTPNESTTSSNSSDPQVKEISIDGGNKYYKIAEYR